MTIVQTVTGPIDSSQLGRVLMHEHLAVGYPGWESATNDQLDAVEMLKVCVDHLEELKDLGYSSLVDPCPSDLGRDPELMVAAAEATGFNIICAVGLYHEAEGSKHWHFRSRFEDLTPVLTELYVDELTNGIGSTGIKPGIIKAATGPHEATGYELVALAAAAAASIATDTPITTHTDEGTLGDLQQQVFSDAGVPPHRVVIGHSCGSTDTDYHLGIARRGSYLGFDRFGIPMVSDDDRVAALARVIAAGAGDRVVVSHDSVWCWKGQPWPPKLRPRVAERFVPTLFDRQIVPKLIDVGVDEAAIARLTDDNPRAYFESTPLASLT
ncbi:MAG: phosphotriesterase [Acidimicrobiaceae bacterium]|jgi:phosphotriesterase-related protein|nr:phosphotriesterase [Acidimicrobiaceae bacterium]MBT5579519.1 phosphotriesterase [Acidimicrobiaceae bacterium]